MPKPGEIVFIGRRGKMLQLPARFDEMEWKEHGKSVFASVSDHCEFSERVAAESFRTAAAATEINDRLKENITWQLKKRVEEIGEWKNELQRKYDQCSDEADQLSIFVRRCENLLHSFPPHLQTNMEIIRQRFIK